MTTQFFSDVFLLYISVKAVIHSACTFTWSTLYTYWPNCLKSCIMNRKSILCSSSKSLLTTKDAEWTKSVVLQENTRFSRKAPLILIVFHNNAFKMRQNIFHFLHKLQKCWTYNNYIYSKHQIKLWKDF